MIDFFIKQGDTAPRIEANCIDENSDPIDLTAAVSVKFNMINPGTDTAKVNGATAAIVDSPTGLVAYQWAGTDTDTPADYDGEFEVTWSDGTKTTFPNFRYIKIRVVADIA